MRIAIGIVLGVLTGLLLNLVIGAVTVVVSGPGDDGYVPARLVVIWAALLCAVCSFTLLVGTRSIRRVLWRVSLLGLVLSGLMAIVGPFAAFRMLGPSRSPHADLQTQAIFEALNRSTTSEAVVGALIVLGLSGVLALACGVSFFLLHSSARTEDPDQRLRERVAARRLLGQPPAQA